MMYVVGFSSPRFTVSEGDDAANIQIGVISGSLRDDIVVQFSTVSSDAAGQYVQITYLWHEY